MTGTRIDLSTWSRTPQFRFFQSFQRPHYAITARVDATRLMAAKADGLSPYRTTLWAIGAGLHAVPALRHRFKGDEVWRFDRLDLSMTVPVGDDIRFGFQRWHPDRARFDAELIAEIARVEAGADLDPRLGQMDVAFASCLPWLDYTALDNAMPYADDCIPRIAWGKIVETGRGHDMAMTLQAHHALVDGRHMADFFRATEAALNAL